MDMFKCYRQLEHSDCGLSCIRMVARHYGTKVSLQYLRSVVELTRIGISINDISDCFAHLGFESASVAITEEYVYSMPLPAILYWEQKHFVVLYRISGNGVFHIADPAQGKIKYSRGDFMRYWIPEGHDRGIAVLADPKEDYVPKKLGSDNTFARFLSYLGGFMRIHRGSLAWALLLTLCLMGADLCLPVLLKHTVDEGIMLRDVGLIGMLLLMQFAITLGSLVASYAIDVVMTKAGLRMHLDMIDGFLTRLAGFPLSFFDTKVSSDLVQKLNDHSRIKSFILSAPTGIVVTLLSLVVFSVLLVRNSPLVFGVFIAMSLLELGWYSLFLGRRKSLDYASFAYSSANYTHANELTTGMADLKVNNAENVKISQWKATQKSLNDVSLKSTWLRLRQEGGRSLLGRFKDLGVTGICALMVVEGEISIGTMMLIGYVTGRLGQPFNTLAGSMTAMQDAVMSYARVDNVMHDASGPRGKTGYISPTIVLDGVWFRYPGASSPYVLRDITLEVAPGQVLAIVGESGCGKSTLIKLMLGFYVPQRGEVRLSGTDVCDLDDREWLRHCGVIMQECRIFTGSVLDNVTLSSEKPDMGRARELLEVVGLTRFVDGLPMGINTRIGVSGVEMSGGQKQRLMIARALYKCPDLLFLDEATSSLDANNERSILENIMARYRDCTVIVAAHRLSTVQGADEILFMKDGCIAERGTHAELLARRGMYHSLVQNQLQLSV